MKQLALVVALLFAIGTAVPTFAGYEELFSTVKSTSWGIYVRTTGGMSAVCSATAFDSNPAFTLMLSAGHCFLGNDLKRTDFLVTQDHRTFYKASLLKSGFKPRQGKNDNSSDTDDYEGNDWSIVKAEVGNQPVLPVGNSTALTLGEDIIMVGVPFGVDFLGAQGIIGSKDLSLSKLVWNHYYGANIYVAGGNSGTGVVSVKQRAVVGIVVAGPGSQSNMMIFTPVDRIDFEGIPQ